MICSAMTVTAAISGRAQVGGKAAVVGAWGQRLSLWAFNSRKQRDVDGGGVADSWFVKSWRSVGAGD